VLWYLWQLPQNLLGLALKQYFRSTRRLVTVVSPQHDAGLLSQFQPYVQLMLAAQLAAQANLIPGPASAITQWQLVLVKDVAGMGAISLGKYLIFNTTQPVGLLIAHERGHQLQSRKLGPLYLLIIGVPSMSRAIWQKHRQKAWTAAARKDWYERGWPESAANQHGGITLTQWRHWMNSVNHQG